MLEVLTKIQAHSNYPYINIPKIIVDFLKIKKGDVVRIGLTKKNDIIIKLERGHNENG